MGSYKSIKNVASWLVFAVAAMVFFFSAERTGSLWDCGEFILGAYKLQVVHPPGAPLFLLIGRLFTWFAEILSDDPADIAFAVNLLSGLCTAFAAFFIARITMILGRIALVGRQGEVMTPQAIALAGAGITAGLASAFTTSVWFSAVEGEVYAMSTFFTTLTLWSTIKWYSLPDDPQHDRWLIFSVYAAGLSIGVHLLSILTFPALALFYYFKRHKEHTFWGIVAAAGVGGAIIVGLQVLVITGIPRLWRAMELLAVNGLGLPFHTGLIPTVLIIAAIVFFGLRYAHRRQSPILQHLIIGAALSVIGFSSIGVTVIRANANTPININEPSDAMRLLPYLNREQYGERALLYGPHFAAQPTNSTFEDRYGRVGDRYEIVDHKIEYEFNDKDKMLFPRMGDYTQNRAQLYKEWMGLDPRAPLPPNRPNQGDNISFFVNYQLGWMYWRYFMWNFSGRQNGEQGYEPWNKSQGHYLTGIKPLDEARLHNMDKLPEAMKKHKAYNRYYLLPFIFGLIGLLFHYSRSQNEFIGILALFVITGIGIIVYSNQPPREPRERDYVLAGSFFTYCIWMGMAVLALFELLRKRISGSVAAGLASAVVLAAPLLMGFENYDDHSRRFTTGARDYANNFLQSCAPNAIVFTYGDNDTYPLWYAQEVEGIRPDVRVVNLSLIAVDWYIDGLRRKINESPAIKMTIPSEAYRGKKRNSVVYGGQQVGNRKMPLQSVLRFIGERHPVRLQGGREAESFLPTRNTFIPVNRSKVLANELVGIQDTANIVNEIPINLANKNYLTKDELAILDIIGSNFGERPIYFAVTCRPDKMFGLRSYSQLEGLALKIVPVRSDSQDQQYGLVGSGRVNKEAVYNNVMNKFKWGNFDKYDLFVDDSYAPSIQSHYLAIRRTAEKFLDAGDSTRSVELVDKYFEAFPHMNFPYDYRAWTMISIYLDAGLYDKAKPHMEILARETADHLEFYQSLDQELLRTSYGSDFSYFQNVQEGLQRAARQEGDDEFLQKLQQMFEPYKLQPTENQPMGPPGN